MASFIKIDVQVTKLWEKYYYFWITPRMRLNKLATGIDQVLIARNVCRHTVYNFAEDQEYRLILCALPSSLSITHVARIGTSGNMRFVAK